MEEFDDYYLKRWQLDKDWINVGSSKIKRFENLKLLLKKYDVELSAKCIDYGCGSGWLLYFLNKLGFKNVYAFDITPKVLEKVKRNCPFIKQIWCTSGNFEREIPSVFFDLCLSSEVYEHIPYSEKTVYIKNIKNILVQGGFLYLTTPNMRYKKSSLSPELEQPIEDWETYKGVKEQLTVGGFEVLEYGSFYFKPYMSIYHKLFFGTKATLLFEFFGLKRKLDAIYGKRMLGLSMYFFAKKVV